jgi:hypothetical protein
MDTALRARSWIQLPNDEHHGRLQRERSATHIHTDGLSAILGTLVIMGRATDIDTIRSWVTRRLSHLRWSALRPSQSASRTLALLCLDRHSLHQSNGHLGA